MYFRIAFEKFRLDLTFYSHQTILLEALPEAVETVCGKCTDKQKVNIRKVIKAIQQKHPTQWEELVKKNDPTGQHRANFEKFIQES